MSTGADQLLEVFIELLAERVAEKLASRTGGPAPRYATARDNPLRSPRAFLDAARRGDFPTFKLGRCVAALWSDVERHVEGRKRPKKADPADDDRALLQRHGLLLRSGGRG